VAIVPPDAQETVEESTLLIKTEQTAPTIEDLRIPKDDIKRPETPRPLGLLAIVEYLVSAIVFTLLLSFALSCVLSFAFTVAAGGQKPNLTDPNSSYNTMLSNVLHVLAKIVNIVAIYFVVVKRYNNDFITALHLFPISRQGIKKYLAIASGMVAFILLFSILIYATPIRRLIPETVPILEDIGKDPVWFTVGALLAPFSEELLYRGFPFRALLSKLSQLWAGIIVSVLFTAMHAEQLAYNPILLLPIAAGAIIMIYIRIKTDSLTNCIAFHFMYNFLLTVILWLSILVFGYQPSSPVDPNNV